MKIRKILIENIKGIKKISLEDIGDTVVLAGPNGCGKSCIFDALRLLKTSYGTYTNNEINQLYQEFGIKKQEKNSYQSLFRDHSKDILVECDFEISKEEIQDIEKILEETIKKDVFLNLHPKASPEQILNFTLPQSSLQRFNKSVEEKTAEIKSNLHSTMHSAKIQISPNGIPRTSNSPVIAFIFSHYLPNDIGSILHISAHRQFQKNNISNININTSKQSQNQNGTLYDTNSLLNRFHNDLASNYLYSLIKKDLKTEAAEEDYLTKSIHELFEKFIPNKKYIGPQLDQDGNLRFAVKTRDGYEHDINELSSGEKEILMGYVQIYGKSPKNSILMLDEPELHLNPRLIKGLPDFYKNHLGENFNNQIWLVTHSDTILSESAKNTSYTVFHITAADNSTIQQAHKISSKDEADKALLELIGDLSQYKPDRKIVIVEGENSEFDKKMITKLFPDFSNSVNLISAGSKSKVSSLHNLMQHVFKESGYNNKVYGIVDSDFDGKKEHKIYTWDSYHIENYLIIPEILSEITTSRLNESMHLSIEQALHELIKIAKDKVKYLAQQATQKYINDEIVKQIKINCDKKPETIANDLKTTLLSSKNRIVTIADRMGMDNTIENVFNKNCTDLNKSFDEDSWLKKFPGREILKEFRKLHVSWMDYEGFRDQIIERMINKNIEPSGMKEVLEKIANTNP